MYETSSPIKQAFREILDLLKRVYREFHETVPLTIMASDADVAPFSYDLKLDGREKIQGTFKIKPAKGLSKAEVSAILAAGAKVDYNKAVYKYGGKDTGYFILDPKYIHAVNGLPPREELKRIIKERRENYTSDSELNECYELLKAVRALGLADETTQKNLDDKYQTLRQLSQAIEQGR